MKGLRFCSLRFRGLGFRGDLKGLWFYRGLPQSRLAQERLPEDNDEKELRTLCLN